MTAVYAEFLSNGLKWNRFRAGSGRGIAKGQRFLLTRFLRSPVLETMGLWPGLGTGCRGIGSGWITGAGERGVTVCRLQIRASRKCAFHHAFEHRDQRIGKHRELKIRQSLFPSLDLKSVQ